VTFANIELGDLALKATHIKVGDGMEEGINMGPAVDKAQYETDLRYLEIAKKEGCKCLIGGAPLADGKLAKGYFVAPTVFDNVKPEHKLAQEEELGPVLAALRVNDSEQAMNVANNNKFEYTCST
jgi:acyl-CoA reductase-like NAD-dependent aldehyde dehydrogenase